MSARPTASVLMHPYLQSLSSRETSPEAWIRHAIEGELAALRAVYPSSGELSPLTSADLLPQVRNRASGGEPRVAQFFQRVGWLLDPGQSVEGLDPRRDRDRIFHFVAREFRSELKVFAVLHEMRAAVSLPLATFFLQTGEFSERGVKRIVDTVLLVCNILEWGVDSARGRQCLGRINEIHARYAIPNAAFKFVLAGIMFIPWEFNQRFGFRRMTEVERLGWFHAFDELGRAMGIGELDGDFDATYAWYREVSHAGARFGRNKERLIRDILGQVLARYPAPVRAVVASSLVAGMDDVYLTASALPRAPEALTRALGRLFAAEALRAPPPGFWLQSLLPSSVYPDGYRVEELGAGPRRSAPRLESREVLVSSEELARRVDSGEWLLVFDGAVYDLTHFAEHHPGGRGVLERYRGKDATAAFRAAPHSSAAAVFRENYRVGRLALVEATNSEPPDTPALPSTQVLGVSRNRIAPEPAVATTLGDFARALLPLVNERSKDALTVTELEAQLEALCRF